MPPRRDVGTFTAHKALKDLPALLRTWRALERQLAPLRQLEHALAAVVLDERATRGRMAEAFQAAGILKNHPVTCNGYEVTRRERKGAEAYNPTLVIKHLIAEGVEAGVAAEALAYGLETEPPAIWVTVEIPPGAAVRRPRA